MNKDDLRKKYGTAANLPPKRLGTGETGRDVDTPNIEPKHGPYG